MSTTDRAAPTRLSENDILELNLAVEMATPLPWRHHDMEGATIVAGNPGAEVANCCNGFGDQEQNAALIYDGLNALPALLSELQALRAASEWRTDMENAPKDGTEILIANFTDPMVIQNDYWTAGGIAFDEYPGWCDWPPGAHDPTHWKPITPPDSTNTDILASQESDGN